jgi:ArsR family transcriptional regulator
MTLRVKKAASPVDRMFRAFSDRTRLRILHLLRDGECCVGDIATILRLEQPSASRHLAYLRQAGLVVGRKTAQWAYYSLAPAVTPFHQKLLECLACCFSEVPELRADAARAARVARAGGGCCPEAAEGRPVAAPATDARCCTEARGGAGCD